MKFLIDIDNNQIVLPGGKIIAGSSVKSLKPFLDEINVFTEPLRKIAEERKQKINSQLEGYKQKMEEYQSEINKLKAKLINSNGSPKALNHAVKKKKIRKSK